MKNSYFTILAAFSILSIGCGIESTTTITSSTSTPSTNAASGDSPSPKFDSKRIAHDEPTDLISVGEAREKAEDKQEIRIVGRIGGAPDPFVEGMAAFTLIDLKLPDCAGGECSDDGCCSPDELKRNIATVKFVGDDGRPIDVDARELLNVRSRAKVAVAGTAKRDDAGNLVVVANRLYVYPQN